MTENLISKTAFAAVMGVDRAQPTRWAKAGMPVAPDGRVDAVLAAIWVRENVDDGQRRRRSIGRQQLANGERKSWEKELVFAYYMDADEASRIVAELLLPFLPLPTVRGIAAETLRRMRKAAVEVLAEDVAPPSGCATWADDSRFQGPVMTDWEWQELVEDHAAGKLAKVADV